MKINRTIRFEKEILDRAEQLGIDINDACRLAIIKEIKLKCHSIRTKEILMLIDCKQITVDEGLKRLSYLME